MLLHKPFYINEVATMSITHAWGIIHNELSLIWSDIVNQKFDAFLASRFQLRNMDFISYQFF